MAALEVGGEQTSGYNVTTSSTATRTNTALIDIPQTVDIVTNQFWADLHSTTWDESFSYMANVEVRNRFAGFGDTVSIRGFQTLSNSMAEDGILVGDQHYKRDLSGYDRLEIVKGPPSAVQGRASGFGYFNYILKKPTLTDNFDTATFSYLADEHNGSGARVEFDSNQTLNAAHTLGFRIAGAWQESNDYINFMHTRIVAVYPTFRWKLTPNTELVETNVLMKDLTPSREEGHGFADYVYRDRILFPIFKNSTDPITALNLPINFNLSGPGENAYEEVVNSSLFLTQKITSFLTYRQAVNVRANSADSQAFTDENNSTTLINYAYIHSIVEWHNVAAQGDLFGSYKTSNGWIDGYTLVGYNVRSETITTSAWNSIPTMPTLVPVKNATTGAITGEEINIVTAAQAGNSAAYYAGRVVPQTTPSTYTYEPEINIGYYGEEALGLFHDRLILNGSARRDHDHFRVFNYLTGKEASSSDTLLNSYRFGATVKATDNVALYAVKSVQNNPATVYQAYNGLLAGDPRLAQFFTVSPVQLLYEYGVKTELFHGRMSFTADHWQLSGTGSVVNSLASGTSEGQNVTFGTEIPLGNQETHGFEFETYGAVTDRLSIVANYTRMFSSVQNSADPTHPNDLIPLTFCPIWSFNVFAKYEFHDPEKNGLEIKAGIRYIGPMLDQVTLTSGATLTPIPNSQWTADAGAGYKWNRYMFDFLVSNLNDSAFVITRDIPPRTYHVSASVRF